MTFPFPPRRSSWVDDTLDQALNAWASRDHHNGHSGLAEESTCKTPIQTRSTLTADALDFHRWADEARRTDPAATGPAADTWNRVLRNTAQEESRGRNMSSAVVSTKPQAAIIQEVPQFGRQQISRYLNYAALLLVVFGIAFAGAFMAMQVNQPGDSVHGLASVGIDQEDAGNGVCDVESLTVDEAIQIVQSPMFYVYGGEESARADGWGTILDQGEGNNFVGAPLQDWSQLAGLTPHAALPVSAEDFAAAYALAEEYRDCLATGTRGQVWALFDPVIVQYEIATRIPLLQPMDVTRSATEELLNEPIFPSTAAAQIDREWQVNPDIDLAVRIDHALSFHTTRSVLLPIQVLDRDGAVIASYDIYGKPLSDDQVGSGDAGNLVVAYSPVTKNWYVVGAYESARFHILEGRD